MRKKSHILLAKWIAKQTDINLYQHKVSFYIGSVLPDCQPSFFTRKHEFQETFEKVGKNIRLLTECKSNMDDAFWLELGEVLHYIADYFTFPHNDVFGGNIWEHGRYEKQLKYKLKECIGSKSVSDFAIKKRNFTDVNELIRFIEEEHRNYLQYRRSLEDDISYIIRVSTYVFRGIFQLRLEKTSGIAA